jgi:hypothetical protein
MGMRPSPGGFVLLLRFLHAFRALLGHVVGAVKAKVEPTQRSSHSTIGLTEGEMNPSALVRHNPVQRSPHGSRA